MTHAAGSSKSQRSLLRLLLSKRALLILLAALAAGAATALVLSLHRQLAAKAMAEETARQWAANATRQAARAMDELAGRARSTAMGLAARLGDGSLDPDQAPAQMTRLLQDNPEFYGGTITFRPFAYRADRRLHAPYCLRQDRGIACKTVEEDYDYTEPSHDWYHRPMARGPIWTEPYWCDSGKEYMATFSTPFKLPRDAAAIGTPTGVVTIDITVAELHRLARSLDLGRGAFPALTSRAGNYLYHPDPSFVRSRKTIQQVAQELDDPDRVTLADWARDGKAGIVRHTSTTTGRDSWLVVEPIPETGWSLQVTCLLDEFKPAVQTVRRQAVDSILWGLALLALLATAFAAARGSVATWWCISGGISVAMAAGIGLIWSAALTSSPAAGAGGTAVMDPVSLHNARAAALEAARRDGLPPPEFVPTGIFLQSVEFLDNRNVRVAGLAWQEYRTGEPRAWEPGIQFPEGLDMTIEEAYSHEQRGMTLKGWRFEGTIREQFDYASFPLDEEAVWLRLWPARVSDRVALVPDLDSYPLLNPTTLPGLAENLVLPGWRVQETRFELKQGSYRTNFGLAEAEVRNGIPDLHYTVSIQRDFLDAFISHLTPLLVVAVMLFAVLLSVSRNPDRVSLLGSQTTTILSFAAALFFVVVFGHIDLRQKLGVQAVFYLEYFYLIMYAAILAVSIIALLFVLGERVRWLQLRDCLVPKLLYFPALMGALLAATLSAFY